jgi:O-antigen/teichoic acid export membrane protein
MLTRFLWFLCAAIVPATLGFVTLPLTTFKLDPDDFGLFAVITSYSTLCSSVAGLGSSYMLAARFAVGSPIEQKRLVSTILITVGLVWCGIAALTILIWNLGLRDWIGGTGAGGAAVVLALMTAFLGYPWTISSDVLTLTGSSRQFAMISVVQSVVGSVVTVGALYLFNCGATSLYWGAFGGGCVAMIGALRHLKAYLSISFDWGLMREMLRYVPTITGASLLEGLQTIVERNLMAGTTGLAAVGVYSHSQSYRRLVFVALKSVSRAAFPDTLEEARRDPPTFSRTRHLWFGPYAGVVLFGVLMAVFGDWLVGALTHGKFVSAAPLAAMWMIYVLAQFSGRSQNGFLIGRGHGLTYARLSVAAGLVGLITTILLVPAWGARGAYISCLAATVLSRVLMHVCTRRIAAVPFDDLPPLIGAAVIAGSLFLVEKMGRTIEARATVSIVALGIFGVVCRRELYAGLSGLIGQLRRRVKPTVDVTRTLS